MNVAAIAHVNPRGLLARPYRSYLVETSVEEGHDEAKGFEGPVGKWWRR